MSEIKARKTIALLTTGVLLIVLSLAMPAVYAKTVLDPHVFGSGFGIFSAVGACADKSGSFVTIDFEGLGSTMTGHGSWTISIGSSQLLSGTINSVSTTGSPSIPTGFSVKGVVTSGCGSGATVAISGGCGTGDANPINFASSAADFVTASGPVTCKG